MYEMTEQSIDLRWSAQLSLAPQSPGSNALPGDKILLPASALEQLLAAATTIVADPEPSGPSTSTFDPFNPYSYDAERQARALQSQGRQQQQLPHPLTFRLVNPQNGHVIHAGIREFSAAEGQVVLSSFLRHSLGLEDALVADHGTGHASFDDGDETMTNGHHVDPTLPRITVHAKQLSKGTYVRLRPLEAGYDPEDWKSLLEQHLRTNFTTLTNGEILTIPGGRGAGGKRPDFRFLIDKLAPEGDGICVVDTDVEVDIEALNEEQARETLRRKLAKSNRTPLGAEGSSSGGTLILWEGQQGQILENEYADYQITTWDRAKGVDIELGGVNDDEEVDLFVSPFAARQRAKPREGEHVFGDFSSTHPKRIRLEPTNVALQEAEALWISVHGYPLQEKDVSEAAPKPARKYYIRATPVELDETNGTSNDDDEPPGPDDIRCQNCHQWVPARTMLLHENFCLRNNVLCPQCSNVFQKSSPEWKNHWHCPHDKTYGNTPSSHTKHDQVEHTPEDCPGCSYQAPSLSVLAHHRTAVCPAKLILCRFCHLIVPQEGEGDETSAEILLSDLTPHERADGARTTECHLCGRPVRLRDMDTHLRHHSYDRRSRPTPRICRNVNCGRTLGGAGKRGVIGTTNNSNELGLCGICYGPLYVAMYDPDGKALRRRVERRYLTQLRSGCGHDWCRNSYCRVGRAHLGKSKGEALSIKEAEPLVRPVLQKLSDKRGALHFCVDEASQQRRILAEMLAGEAGTAAESHASKKTPGEGYRLEWCVAGLEAEGGDLTLAGEWLASWAPSRAEAQAA